MIDNYKRAKDLNPQRMNPLIANVFSKMGVVEELGSVPRRIFRYTPLIAGGKEPLIEEEDVYKVSIPIEAGASDWAQKSIQKTPVKILFLIRNNPYVTKISLKSFYGV